MNSSNLQQIRNHFQKLRQGIDKHHVVLQAAEIADLKRNRGEPLSDMPLLLKNSYQAIQSGVLWPPRPNGMIDFESTPSAKAPPRAKPSPRRSDIMSLLDSDSEEEEPEEEEPEEEKPRREPDQQA
jgi:hypothetical protein